MSENQPLALVTGASSGIGLELARQFAAHGHDLLIAAENDAIEAVAVELRTAGPAPVQVEAVQVDLATSDGVQRLYTALGARPLGVAALNAGVGLGGAFAENDLATELKLIDLNVKSTVHLAKLILPDLVARNEGRILITSSIAATMPGSFQAVYNASKSFLQSFAEALQNELSDSAVTVTSLMPGPTETNFFHRAGMDDTPVGRSSKDDPAEVAKQAYAAVMAGKDRVVAESIMTKAQELANKVLPDKVKAAVHRKMAEPDS
ncbi:SDR family NAD(P)-dependent oxidoreductase [Kribbella sp. CA-293567]|uniref:SDR family NAD(P)-dependent oxidoreductase n=1 Tax=Kribbella sp. CA-293567 TaxID=3002436 RepID=UPI0022DD7011|nr:SDR family NAD(P)-dependent oxidoreductase [Kribbella sp. CA-293567]WBQ07937.1 SDR family NAD(P)-dependent oxidoreductase [Kribbella sp. CA-293567]